MKMHLCSDGSNSEKDIWLGLNMYLSPLEQIDVVNQVLFGQGGLTGTDEEKMQPDSVSSATCWNQEEVITFPSG